MTTTAYLLLLLQKQYIIIQEYKQNWFSLPSSCLFFNHVLSLIDLLISCNIVSHGFLPRPDTQGGLLGQEVKSKIQEFGLALSIFSADDAENISFQQIAASIGAGSASNLLHCSIAICYLQRNLKPAKSVKHDAQQVLHPKLQVHGKEILSQECCLQAGLDDGLEESCWKQVQDTRPRYSTEM